MAYRIIHCDEFTKYKVRNVPVKAKLVLAWCQVSGDEIYCVNVIKVSSSMKYLIPLVREANEKNVELEKKISEKKK
jgi:hypothetical protein